MEASLYQNHLNILRSELIVALGCTEPIAIAFAAARARDVLGEMPEHCICSCSGNIVKNVMGVTVPNSGGMKGIPVFLSFDRRRSLHVQDQTAGSKACL